LLPSPLYRAYATRADAEAASNPPDDATTVVQIITGVPRSPAWGLTTAQLQDLIAAVERQIAADDADMTDDRT
jgi:mono/diheme cytochrome c family protein